ncbi:MAG: hypothetical protein QOK40_1310 [Miltoncostaeaceae bacterium]|nr:hypothetical protein [Miltoncostaeaceae bacterium]
MASDALRATLSFFLVVVGIGLALVFFRLGELLGRLSQTIKRVTEEMIVMLSKAETTMDGVNLELARVDEIMQSAVGATKAAERTATAVSKAVAVPAKKVAGLAAGLKEATATLRARMAANRVAAGGGAPTAGAVQDPTAGAVQDPTAASATTSVGSSA